MSAAAVAGELGPRFAAFESKKTSPNIWLIALTVTLATFMELLDTSIANVALPAHLRRLGHQLRREHVGAHQLPRGQRRGVTAERVASRVFGRKNYYMGCVALFSVSSLLCGLAPSSQLPDLLSRAARRRRRRPGAGGAGDPGRYFSGREARVGLRALQHGDRHRAGHRAAAGRVDHRQLFLALGLLHQCSHRNRLAGADQPVRLGLRRVQAGSGGSAARR